MFPVSTQIRKRSSIGDLLAQARSLDLSLEGQVLLADLLGRSRSWVLAHPEAVPTATQLQDFQRAFESLQQGAALPHLLGWWEFYGRRFQVTPHVLIPRPETELLIDTALGYLHGGERTLDIGTGSGCVAVTLAAEREAIRVTATDLSMKALAVARANAAAHGVQARVNLLAADLLRGISGRFDLVCANLPYVASLELQSLVVGRREPHLALDGGGDGLALIRRTLADLPARMSADAVALFEIDPRQSSQVLDAAEAYFKPSSIDLKTDLTGRPRLLEVRNG